MEELAEIIRAWYAGRVNDPTAAVECVVAWGDGSQAVMQFSRDDVRRHFGSRNAMVGRRFWLTCRSGASIPQFVRVESAPRPAAKRTLGQLIEASTTTDYAFILDGGPYELTNGRQLVRGARVALPVKIGEAWRDIELRLERLCGARPDIEDLRRQLEKCLVNLWEANKRLLSRSATTPWPVEGPCHNFDPALSKNKEG